MWRKPAAGVLIVLCLIAVLSLTSTPRSVAEEKDVYGPCVNCDDGEKGFLKVMRKKYQERKSTLDEADSIASSAGLSQSDDAFLAGLKEGIAKRSKELQDLYVVPGPESSGSSEGDEVKNPDLETPAIMSKADKKYVAGLEKSISNRQGELKDLYTINSAKDSDPRNAKFTEIADPQLMSKKDEEYVASIKKAIADRAGEIQDLYTIQPLPAKKEEDGQEKSVPDLYTVSLSTADKNYVSNLKAAIETRAKELREMENPKEIAEVEPGLPKSGNEVKGLGDSVVISAKEEAEINSLKAKTIAQAKELATFNNDGSISKGEQQELDQLQERMNKRAKWLAENGH